MIRIKFKSIQLWFFAIFNIAIRLIFYNTLGYHRDELLYFSLGNHPALGYATTPPLIGWLAWIIHHTLGYSLFAAKLFPALMSGAMVFILYALVTELGGGQKAIWIVLCAFTIAIMFLRTFYLFQPVFLDVFFWSIMTLVVVRYINRPSDRLLWWFGLLLGLGMLNKYLVLLLALALLAVLPFTPYRRIFARKAFYLSLLLAFIIFLPNLVWQAEHHMRVFRHMKELHDNQLVHVDRLSFMIDQLMMPGAATIIIIPGFFYLLFSKSLKKYRSLGIAMVVVLAVLCFLRGKSYYTMGIYPLFMASGAVFLEKQIKRKWVLLGITGVMILLSVPVIPIGIPIYGPEKLVLYFKNMEEKYGIDVGRRFEDGSIHSLPQDYADMLGWEDIAKGVYKAEIAAGDTACIIYCENYGEAGAVAVLGKKYHLPEPICFNDAYYYWAPHQIPDSIQGLIYVNDKPGKDIRALFSSIRVIGGVKSKDAREYGTKVYLCTRPSEPLDEFWKNVINRVYGN